MIFGEHKIAGVKVSAAQNHGDGALMSVEQTGWHEAGLEFPVESRLDRADVERLRDLCDEALA